MKKFSSSALSYRSTLSSLGLNVVDSSCCELARVQFTRAEFMRMSQRIVLDVDFKGLIGHLVVTRESFINRSLYFGELER